MPDILLDITRLLDRTLKGRLPTGVDRVDFAYMRHFRGRAAGLVRFGGRWIELSHADSSCLFDVLLTRPDNWASLARWYVGKSYVKCWTVNKAPRMLFNTGHSGLNKASYIIESRRRRLHTVFFLHDIIPISHPEYCRPGEAWKHRKRVTTMLSIGSGLILNSADTRNELEEFAAKEGLKIPPCIIAPLAPAQLPSPESSAMLSMPYFVVLGTIEPRKNHLLLLQVWRQLVQDLGEAAPRLVVIGQRGWECEQVIDLLERCESLKGYVIEKSRCSDAELATWLHYAQALLFPSFVEGYGIPLVEALSLGVPVIASNLGVFHEIAGNIPEYVDPLDGLGWKQLILDYLHDGSQRRLAQFERMKHFSAPTWDEHFEKIENFLKTLNNVCPWS